MGEGEALEKQQSDGADSTAVVGGGTELGSPPPDSPVSSPKPATKASNGLPPLSPTGGPKLHRRNVSWGDGKQVVDKLPSQDGRSPPVSKKLGSFELDSETLSHITNPLLPDPSSKRETKSMADLVNAIRKNPLESEAESYVLSAIEERDNAAESSPSTLLGSVPDEAAILFKEQDNDQIDSGSVGTATRGRPPPAVRNTSTGSHAASSASNRAHRTPKKKVHHARNASTMEETLAGLTTQLAGLHSQERKGYGVASMTQKQIEQDKMQLDDPNAGSADTLRKAANILFRGKKDTAHGTLKEGSNWRKISASLQASTENDSEMPSSAEKEATAKANWGKLRMAMQVTSVANQHKKDDGDGDDEFDPEKGDDSSDYEHESDDDDGNGKGRHKKRLEKAVKESIVGDFQVFVGQRRNALWAYLKLLVFIVIPAIGLSCILFYLAGNPPTGIIDLNRSNNTYRINTNDEIVDIGEASVSYWLLFIAVRQVITFSLARAVQVFIVDFLCLNTRAMVTVFGNLLTLLVVQSRGWPFIITVWSIINFGLLCGKNSFVRHWLYWQDPIGVFNEENPSGQIPDGEWNRKILLVAIGVGVTVSAKRLWLGLYLGRKTYTNYAPDLTKVMKKVLMLCQIAALARDLGFEAKSLPDGEKRNLPSVEEFGISQDDFDALVQEGGDDDASQSAAYSEPSSRSLSTADRNTRNGPIIDPKEYDLHNGNLTDTQRAKINELLGAWEEPEKEHSVEENVSISGILQFRRSLSCLDTSFMFSIAWGDVSTRERAIISSQQVFKRLLARCPRKSLLSFDVLALATIQPDGTMDVDKLKDMIRLLRPDRDGKLGMLDFVKSVDSVYKEARLLRASVRNSEKIDRALEKSINVVFYVVVICVVTNRLGLDPLALFLSLSSIILAFAFMIGSSSAKMFEGWLFILVRRPYDIGDRINIASPESETSVNGSASWFVRDVDLFTTTVVYAATGEKATLSNGSLGSSRVINMARSPNAVLFVFLKFSVDVPYERIMVFDEALRKFIKSRPREWAQLLAFRATQIVQDQGYVEYITVLQHRESWQNIGALLTSKAEVASFCLELSKKLDMRYRSPPMPIDLSIVSKGATGGNDSVEARYQELSGASVGDDVAALFAKKD